MRTFPLLRLAAVLFAIPWIVFGIQHYMYAEFVSGLVPAYMPFHLFWVYFTGTAMLAAGVSFLIRKQVRLAAFLLACMLLLFILMLHPLLLSSEPAVGIHWTRFLQDISIMGAALGLSTWAASQTTMSELPTTGPVSSTTWLVSQTTWPIPQPTWLTFLSSLRTAVIARYCYALPMLVLGAQHFTHNAFVTAKVPAWFPAINFFDYLTGILLIAAAIGILFTVNLERISIILGALLFTLFLLQHVPLLIKDPHNGGEWTGSMLDLALAAGAFIIGRSPSRT